MTRSPAEADALLLEWPDGQRQLWTIELARDRILVSSRETRIDLPREAWQRDIYVARHGTWFIVRFQTFDAEAGFFVSQEAARPFLEHIGYGSKPDDADEPPPERQEIVGSAPLLWPKVSPLAVWALICSSLVFLPVLGVLPAVATIVLLVQHHTRVRYVRATLHSRVMCRVAVGLLIVGLSVSALATYNIVIRFQESGRSITGDEYWEGDQEGGYWQEPEEGPAEMVPAPSPEKGSSSPAILGEQIWKREHNWGLIAASLLVILASLTIHECAHAITAWWMGDDFARRCGRVTLNPIAHIDPFGTVLLPLILSMMGWGVFGYARPVPVRTEVLKNPRRGHIWISLAGPGSNLLLGTVCFQLLLGLGCLVAIFAPGAVVSPAGEHLFEQPIEASGFALAPVFAAACTVLELSFLINIFLAFFNLIPVPPLDGSWVLEHMFPRTIGAVIARIRPFGFFAFLILLYTGILQYLLLPAIAVIIPAYILLGAVTPM